MFPLLSLYGDWALFALRLVFGFIFIVHGWPKLNNLKTTAQNFGAMGFRPGFFWGPLVAFVEFFGGLAVAFGFLIQWAALLFAVEFAVINVWKLVKRQPFVGNIELDLLLLAAALVLLLNGGGALSLDRTLFFGGF